MAIPPWTLGQDELARSSWTDDVRKQYGRDGQGLHGAGHCGRFGNEQFTTFLSDCGCSSKSYRHLLFSQDFTSFALK